MKKLLLLSLLFASVAFGQAYPPSGGSSGITIDSGGVANRIAIMNSSTGIKGLSTLTFDGTTLVVTGAETVSTTLGVTGATTLSTAVASSTVTALKFIPTQVANSAGMEVPVNVKICMDGATCAAYFLWDTVHMKVFGDFFMNGSPAANTTFEVGNGRNDEQKLDGCSGAACQTTNTIQGSDTNVGYNIIGKGTGLISTTGDPFVAVHASNHGVNQSVEYGTATLDGATPASVTVTFATAFKTATAPICICDAVSASAAVACAPGAAASATAVTFNGTATSTNVINYVCYGDR